MRLQLALDGTLVDSLGILARVWPYIDIAEIGTSLILREGVRALPVIHRHFPDVCLLADTKIMDAGELEATIAFEAGASMVTVMGLAEDATLAGVVTAAMRCGGEVMVDLLQVHQPAARIYDGLAMGCDYFCVHTAHDVRRRDSPVEKLRALRFAMPEAALAVAGGVDLTSIDAVVSVRPAIVVVGSAITQASDPVAVAETIRDRMSAYA